MASFSAKLGLCNVQVLNARGEIERSSTWQIAALRPGDAFAVAVRPVSEPVLAQRCCRSDGSNPDTYETGAR